MPASGTTASVGAVTGWLADFFRLVWGLIYWNVRKSRFRWSRGRMRCPCQAPSDSGRALETHCEACLSWHRASRFRRVCPLLVETKDGLRCSADTADVRPFWGRFGKYYGGTFATLYLGAALVAFIALRTIGYPINIVHLVWPGSWHRVVQVRGWFFWDRANRAFAAGRVGEGMLYLTNAYQFDPSNYAVALALAEKLQLNAPARADEIFQQLLTGHPEERTHTAQIWFRSLLARGSFVQIAHLAAGEITADSADASVWMRALIFATRQTRDDEPLRTLRTSRQPGAARWDRVIDCELLLRAGRTAEARALLDRAWDDAGGYALFYQIEALIRLGDAFAALDRLSSYGGRLDDLARGTLLLDAYASAGATQSLHRLVDSLLATPNAPTFTLLTAALIRHPDPVALDHVYAAFTAAHFPLTGDTLGLYLAVFCASGVAGDTAKVQAIGATIKQAAGGPSYTVGLAEAFFRGETPQTRIAGLLAALPMPLELHYALLERYPGDHPSPQRKP